MPGSVTTTQDERSERVGQAAAVRVAWTTIYLRTAAVLDCLCALVAGLVALEIRFDSQAGVPVEYFALTVALPLLWMSAIALAGGYDPRFIGVGSDEFRKVINAGVSLTAGSPLVKASARQIVLGLVAAGITFGLGRLIGSAAG